MDDFGKLANLEFGLFWAAGCIVKQLGFFQRWIRKFLGLYTLGLGFGVSLGV